MTNKLTIPYESLEKVNKLFENELYEAAITVIDSGWYILGKQVELFETEFAAYCHTKFCVGVANGLDAITLSLISLNLKKGAEVIVPSNTYIATILAIVQAGLKPVLVEPDIRTYNICPEEIEKKITKNTAAIIVVHLYGKCCDMHKICAIADAYNLPIVEDCAQAHGAKQFGTTVGSFGSCGAFSFYPTKNLGCLGDGGAITLNNETLFETLKMLRNYGSRTKYYNEVPGYNSRLDEMQAAFLTVKLKTLDKLTEHKRNLAKIYFEELSDAYIKPLQQEEYYDVFHIYNIRCEKRDALKQYLLDKGIGTEIHYPVPPRKQAAMKSILNAEATPIADLIHETTLSLPISFSHSEQDIERTCEVMNSFAKAYL